jgi:UDP-N-acetylmuramoylalanine--D-glutamate ligase
VLVLNADNEIAAGFASEAKGEVRLFSRRQRPENGCFYDGSGIYFNGAKIMEANKILLPGVHNIENYMAAFAPSWI